MNETLSIIIIVILTNLSSITKKKFVKSFDKKLDSMAIAFCLEITLCLFLLCIVMMRKQTYDDVQRIWDSPNKNLLYQYAIICLASIYFYYITIQKVNFSKFTLQRSIYSLLVGILMSKYILLEPVKSNSIYLLIINICVLRFME